MPPSSPAPTRPPAPAGKLALLREALGSGRVVANRELAPWTTFRLGGPADLAFEARSADDLALAVRAAEELEVPWFLLGLGANILIGDLGYRGLVIRNLARRVEVDRETGRLTSESGSLVDPDLIAAVIDHGLSGLEHFAGIPSTVGGALWQNLHFLAPAPARERTMFIEEVLEEAEILSVEGERKSVGREYFRFGYDTSILHSRRDVVLSATFRLQPADPARLRQIVEENLAWRRARHPPIATEPNAGSIFKKIEGIGAGRLIDECGLKGRAVGGARVSTLHANFIVGSPGARAADVRRLIELVQETVERETGYHLETEISFVGDF